MWTSCQTDTICNEYYASCSKGLILAERENVGWGCTLHPRQGLRCQGTKEGERDILHSFTQKKENAVSVSAGHRNFHCTIGKLFFYPKEKRDPVLVRPILITAAFWHTYPSVKILPLLDYTRIITALLAKEWYGYFLFRKCRQCSMQQGLFIHWKKPYL